MLTVGLIGIVSSVLADVIAWVNAKLANTSLSGNGAFIVSLVAALIGGLVKVFYMDHMPFPSLSDFASWDKVYVAFSQVWVVSQVYFTFVAQKFNLRVQA